VDRLRVLGLRYHPQPISITVDLVTRYSVHFVHVVSRGVRTSLATLTAVLTRSLFLGSDLSLDSAYVLFLKDTVLFNGTSQLTDWVALLGLRRENES
jgi:hypothetical protein